MGKRSASTSPRVTKRPTRTDYPHAAAQTWLAVGSCASTMGMVVVAIKLYENALVHTPDSVEALVGWSHLLRMNDIAANETVGSQTAILRLSAAAERYPPLTKSAAFFRELTECYLLVGLNDQAHQLILLAMQLRPDDAALCLLLAQTLIRAGARAQAASALTLCLQLLPLLLAEFLKVDVETARSAHAELAAIAAADGNIDLLIAELTATLLLPPPPLARTDEHIALWCAFATAKERANRIGEALEACERAEVAVGPSPRILITHAYLLLLKDNRANAERAVDLLTKVVEAEPPEVRDAPDSEDGVENAPGDFLPWYLLGKAYNLLDLPRAAYDSYQIALRRASSLPITWLAVGKLYLELKQLPDALAAYSQALRLQLNENLPGTAAAWEGLSCVYERCDDQLADAADACLRAAACFRACHDSEAADLFDARAAALQAAAQGKAPVPPLTQPLGVPSYFVRDLVTLLPAERIAFVQGFARKPEKDAVLPRESRDKAYAPPYEYRAGEHSMQPPMAPPQPYAGLPGNDRTPQPMYQLGPYKADGKLPAMPLAPPGRHWAPQEQVHAPPMYAGPVPLQGPYAGPNGMMTPPMPQGQAHRLSVHPDGYVNHPGYVYGQYMPVHGGVLTHVQPYGTNWRQ